MSKPANPLGANWLGSVTVLSTSVCVVVSSDVRKIGEQIKALSIEDCTRFMAVKEGQQRKQLVTASSVSRGQCMRHTMSTPLCAKLGEARPLLDAVVLEVVLSQHGDGPTNS